MQLVDFHIHSRLSLDGISTLREQVRASREKGVRRLCFTEHIDLGTEEGDFLVDFPEYTRQVEEARRLFPDMSIGMGLEMGDTSRDRARVAALSDTIPLDFKLLSRHQVSGIDPYYGDKFFAGRTREQAARDYVDAVYRSTVSFPDYDALAHIGYVFKFAQGTGFPPLRYMDAPDQLDAILRFLIEHGKALEMNTSRWDRFGDSMPGRDLFARYRELGGEMVTLGSDAHAVEGVAQGFGPACEQLRSLGFGYLTVFTQRKPEMLPL